MSIRPRRSQPLRVLVTVGPTQEPIDPVRFISNRSTGAMGFAIAEAVHARGHRVRMICGPTIESAPELPTDRIITSVEMARAIEKHWAMTDVLIMAAAVADWRPERQLRGKLSRRLGKQTLHLVPTDDILQQLAGRKQDRLLVGFALETGDVKRRAEAKLREKHLDLVVANQVGHGQDPFGRTSRADYLLINANGEASRVPKCSKSKLANVLIDRVEALWYGEICERADEMAT